MPNGAVSRRRHFGRSGRILLGLLCILLAPIVALYVWLLFSPIPLPFLRGPVQSVVVGWLSPNSTLELGDMALAVEGGTWPVLQFSPVSFTDAKTGGRVQMKALDVGFSPLRVLIGQPGAAITMVAPHLQVNQDLLGPRLANFDVQEGANGEATTVRVREGEDAMPPVTVSAGGVSVHGSLPGGGKAGVRSDNDWLIYNMEAAEQSLGDIVTQADQGRFSRLIVRDGVMEMNDAFYGVLRKFTDINVDVSPGLDGKRSAGKFSAKIANKIMRGDVAREVSEDGTVKLSADITNIDFSAFMPFINDDASTMGIVGGGQLSIDVSFNGKTGKVENGVFHTDLTGMDLRINRDHFPIASSIATVNWDPEKGQFKLDDAALKVGESSANVSGLFVLGLDDQFGPTAGISITATDVALHPNDMDAPATNFDKVVFSGWSAPLYGALGIDSLEATKPGVEVHGNGRIDMLNKGLGFKFNINGSGASADDVKRLWPYFLSPDSRDWFVKNVKSGTVDSADLRFAFPVGTLGMPGEDKPIPPNGVSIDMVSSGVSVAPIESLPAVAINGKTHLQMQDAKLTVSGDGANVPTAAGAIELATPAIVLDSGDPTQHVLELSGQVKSGIPSLVALAQQQQQQAIDISKVPVDLRGLAGNADVNLVSTITLDQHGALKSFDYALNGSVADFASAAPIDGHAIKDGQISFTASQKGYQANGKANIDGMVADVQIGGTPDGPPNLLLSSTLDVKDLKSMGFDATNFLSGQVRFAAKPMPDGSVQMDVDVKDAALDIKDLGISKAKGVPGSLQAAVRQNGDLTELSQIKLAFADVDLEGSLEYDGKKGLQSADFSTFALSPGDRAQASLSPIKDGYALQLHGDQLDLKPMLQHFFGLGGGTGGPQASQISQTIALDLDLKRVLGFYKTTAFNMKLHLQLKGSDIQQASLQTQFGDGKSVSVTTNPTPDGKVLSLAFNDFGTLLRFGGIYPRIEGGEGNLVMTSAKGQDGDHGTFDIHNFAVVDESNAAQILDSHKDSRQLIANQNKLSFNSGHVDFIRSSDRIELANGVLTGDTVGGTMHGFIYTGRRQYDLVGTYVPLFGLNNVFQKLPILGPLLGGREGEGLIGVTFAVRGSLDKPSFQINPASLLVPGAFRGLFEYRAKELPEPAKK